MQNLDIAKFGGTSVANYEAMSKCVQVVTQNPNTKLVVVSACAGVTNLLVELASGAHDTTKREEIIAQIFAIHKAIFDKLPDSAKHEAVINEYLSVVRDLAVQATMTRTDMITDRLVSHGELMSSYLITEIFKQQGFKAECFDVRQVMRTDSTYGKAVALVEVISTLSKQLLQPILDKEDTIVVTQGFIGADSSGQTTTLGRGGSDYSAALLGEACHAKTISIWTDVPGVYTTDPRLVPQAMPISELTYLEAAEMATFGAKILHPSTLVPAVRCGIPVYVGSSKEPEKGGTWVRPTTDYSPSFRAVALRKNQTLIVLSSPKMVGATGFLAEVFSIFAKYKLSVDLVSTSEVSIAITLDAGSQTSGLSNIPEALFHELREFCHVKVESGLALVAVIGNNMSRTSHITSEVFSSIDNYAVRMICYGASSHNLCFLVGENEAVEVLTHLHQSLLESQK
ncbi:lysine-sensitive aspartokinase 3 [Anaerobiospirillum sp. NML120448]|uniref:lysine-sensitive aspartokinase 3 n=1 Tax=Anaerobiospirillum sp. NML120448 TaxID=2932816 RepID=UPI001FF402E3|nr:lysine-sensitive aspartokinase 3 [Anaerobiospirillum sp. NML120448]MCK0513579.1 lysine-sensitive aspartokinase 3 [Anaerobiospirillum sp. NML120448]